MLVYQRKNLKTNKIGKTLYASDKKFSRVWYIKGIPYTAVKFRQLKSTDKGVIYI